MFLLDDGVAWVIIGECKSETSLWIDRDGSLEKSAMFNINGWGDMTRMNDVMMGNVRKELVEIDKKEKRTWIGSNEKFVAVVEYLEVEYMRVLDQSTDEMNVTFLCFLHSCSP